MSEDRLRQYKFDVGSSLVALCVAFAVSYVPPIPEGTEWAFEPLLEWVRYLLMFVGGMGFIRFADVMGWTRK